MSAGRLSGIYRALVFALVALIGSSIAAAPVAASDWTGRVSLQGFGFLSPPVDPRQGRARFSVSFEPELHHEWAQGSSRLVFKGFARYDGQDGERTHADVRELYWQKAGRSWELTAGIAKVFWGVTEFRHLVDVLNQTDLVEDLDGEEKLGQPMVHFSASRSWGTLGFFALPGFRERTFPGHRGRPRTTPRVDANQALYESSARAKHVDWALRWSRTFGEWDVGIAHFWGTGREPVLRPHTADFDGHEPIEHGGGPRQPNETVLVPLYPLIHQTSLDLQLTRGAVLGKLEALTRSELGRRFVAGTGGVEYTFTGVGESRLDLGVLAEYMYDGRPGRDAAPFQNDVFLGGRLEFNDVQSTEILAGGAVDLESGAALVRLEASRRIGSRWRVAAKAWAFLGIPESDPLYSLRRDEFVQVEIARYF